MLTHINTIFSGLVVKSHAHTLNMAQVDGQHIFRLPFLHYSTVHSAATWGQNKKSLDLNPIPLPQHFDVLQYLHKNVFFISFLFKSLKVSFELLHKEILSVILSTCICYVFKKITQLPKYSVF